MPDKAEPESFSVANARQAVDEMFEALPKSRRGQFLGHLNEVLVVLDKLAKFHGGDPDKAV
jgi:hypothetical protein